MVEFDRARSHSAVAAHDQLDAHNDASTQHIAEQLRWVFEREQALHCCDEHTGAKEEDEQRARIADRTTSGLVTRHELLPDSTCTSTTDSQRLIGDQKLHCVHKSISSSRL